MTKRTKCPHCAKVADFYNDFCTLCWSHFTKGQVLSAEQIASSRDSYAAALARKKWQEQFDRWQKLVIGPAVILTIASIGWTIGSLTGALAGEVPWVWMLLPGVSLLGFAGGGYLIGGCKALPLASVLLALAALAYGFSSVMALEIDLSRPKVNPSAVIKDAAALVFCGMALFGAIQIFRLNGSRQSA